MKSRLATISFALAMLMTAPLWAQNQAAFHGRHWRQPTKIAISPQGAAVKAGTMQQFTAVCTYRDRRQDDCAAAGGAVWSVSSPRIASINASGLYTTTVGAAWQPNHAYAVGDEVIDSNGNLEQAAIAGTSGAAIVWPGPSDPDNSFSGGSYSVDDYFSDINNDGICPCGVQDGTVSWNMVSTDGTFGFALVTAGGVSDRAAVYEQYPGHTWYAYPTPDLHDFFNYSTAGAKQFLPMNVAVGSTVTFGEGYVQDDPTLGNTTGQPLQAACNWSSSNNSVMRINQHGLATAISPGTVSITCGLPGNATFGDSAGADWVPPGNVIENINVVDGGNGHRGWYGGQGQHTWYVLPGGGTLYSATNPNGQCNGHANQTYAAAGGSGVNRPCAAGSIRDLWADGVTPNQLKWVISGGDTVIVAKNVVNGVDQGYNTGLDSPSPETGVAGATWNPVNCQGSALGCVMPSIPSGTLFDHTRILGANYANCTADSAKTQLNVSYAARGGINVKDSQFVDVACFNITDQAECAGYPFTHRCQRNPGYGVSYADYGLNGILESALTSHVSFTDLFIHGLYNSGIVGATGVGVVGNRVHIRANAEGGINMDDGAWDSGNISVAGGLTLVNSITEFTGCVEEYPIVHNYPYVECRDAKTGGYGDGFGTASTTGDWFFDHDIWRYNFQDGLDLLHAGMQSLTILNSQSIGNDGQPFKVGAADTIVFQNNISNSNCYRILYPFGDEPASAIVPGVHGCRAGGGVSFEFTNLGSYRVQSNTFITATDGVMEMDCASGWDSCRNARSVYQDNLELGYVDPVSPQGDGLTPALFYLGTADYGTTPAEFGHSSAYMPPKDGWAVRNHNIFYNVRDGWCPSSLDRGESCNTQNPQFVNQPASPISAESDLDNFNFHPASSSPAVGAGVRYWWMLPRDQDGVRRPQRHPSIGALEP